MKILIIALSGIGDALMFTPALKLIKKNFPEAQIDALVMIKGAEDIYSSNPNLNKIYYFDFLKEGKLKSLKFVGSLRNKYNASINVYPSNRKEYNIINYFIGAEQRVGVKYLRRDKQNFGFLNNINVLEDDSVHNVQTNIKLCEALAGKKFNEEPPLEFYITGEEKNLSDRFYAGHSIKDDELVIGFHPGCAIHKNHAKRRWEPDKFAELGGKLIKEKNAKILLFGGPDEKELKENIFSRINTLDAIIVDSGSLRESAAIMKRCDLIVTNDSSQMHIAAAMQLKVVAIIGPTNERYIYPWKTAHSIVSLNLDCSPCFFYSPKHLSCSRHDLKFKCIKNLTVEMVYNSVISFLE
jgi:heptosyltransferase-2